MLQSITFTFTSQVLVCIFTVWISNWTIELMLPHFYLHWNSMFSVSCHHLQFLHHAAMHYWKPAVSFLFSWWLKNSYSVLDIQKEKTEEHDNLLYKFYALSFILQSCSVSDYLTIIGTDRDIRVNAMRTAICETFPEPNRRLLQRWLMKYLYLNPTIVHRLKKIIL